VCLEAGGRRGLFVYSANIDCQGPVNKIKLPSRQNDIPGPREGGERILLSGNKGILNIDRNQEPSRGDNIAKFFSLQFLKAGLSC
jgi:hypothetical protein